MITYITLYFLACLIIYIALLCLIKIDSGHINIQELIRVFIASLIPLINIFALVCGLIVVGTKYWDKLRNYYDKIKYKKVF